MTQAVTQAVTQAITDPDGLSEGTTPLGDRLLGRFITAAETGDVDWASLGVAVPTLAPPEAQVIGVTGPPGAGKSTLVDQLIACARRQGLSVGVLAVDPSSPFSGGAVLGDRLRMSRHAGDAGVFIRSMGSRSSTGGLAAAARTAVRLLFAAGKQVVIVETVGVGQAELDIMNIADTTLVVTVPGLGDTVQMNKAGIMEIADLFAVNMADREGVERTMRDIREAIHIGAKDGWVPTVSATVAPAGTGVPELWASLRRHYDHLRTSSELMPRRRQRLKQELADRILAALRGRLIAWTHSPAFDALFAGMGAQAQPEAMAHAALAAALAHLSPDLPELARPDGRADTRDAP